MCSLAATMMYSRLNTPVRSLGLRVGSLGSEQVKYSSGTRYSDNDNVITTLVNRNPRNMEMQRLARKPQGWHLEASSPLYWYKLVLDESHRHITGRVEHYTGKTVVSASTRESAIKQHLYSTCDVSAALNIARVLAQRCLQSGISELYTELHPYQQTSQKVGLFVGAMRDGGVVLEEPDFIHERDVSMFARRKPALPWHVTEDDALNTQQQQQQQQQQTQNK